MNPKKEGSGGVFAEPVDSATDDLFPPPLQAMVVILSGASAMKSGVAKPSECRSHGSGPAIACSIVALSMTVRLIGHLMRVDLSTLNAEKIGALHGRIQRSVVGFVRFVRLGVLEFLPALTTGGRLLVASWTCSTAARFAPES